MYPPQAPPLKQRRMAAVEQDIVRHRRRLRGERTYEREHEHLAHQNIFHPPLGQREPFVMPAAPPLNVTIPIHNVVHHYQQAPAGRHYGLDQHVVDEGMGYRYMGGFQPPIPIPRDGHIAPRNAYVNPPELMTGASTSANAKPVTGTAARSNTDIPAGASGGTDINLNKTGKGARSQHKKTSNRTASVVSDVQVDGGVTPDMIGANVKPIAFASAAIGTESAHAASASTEASARYARGEASTLTVTIKGKTPVSSALAKRKTSVSPASGRRKTSVSSASGRSKTSVSSPSGRGKTSVSSASGRGRTSVSSASGRGRTSVSSASGRGRTSVSSASGRGRTSVSSASGRARAASVTGEMSVPTTSTTPQAETLAVARNPQNTPLFAATAGPPVSAASANEGKTCHTKLTVIDTSFTWTVSYFFFYYSSTNTSTCQFCAPFRPDLHQW